MSEKDEILSLIMNWSLAVSGLDLKIESLHTALGAPQAGIGNGSDDQLRGLLNWCFARKTQGRVVDLVVEIGKLDSPMYAFSDPYMEIVKRLAECNMEGSEKEQYLTTLQQIYDKCTIIAVKAGITAAIKKVKDTARANRHQIDTWRHYLIPEDVKDQRLFIVIGEENDVYEYWVFIAYDSGKQEMLLLPNYQNKTFLSDIKHLEKEIPKYLYETLEKPGNIILKISQIEIVANSSVYFSMKPERWTCLCQDGEVLGGKFPLTYRRYKKYASPILSTHEFTSLPELFDAQLLLKLDMWSNYTQYELSEYWGVQCWSKPSREDFDKIEKILHAVPVLASYREESNILFNGFAKDKKDFKIKDASFLITLTGWRRNFSWARDIVLVWDDGKYDQRLVENILEKNKENSKGGNNDQ